MKRGIKMSLKTGEKEIILGFVLENEDNLKLALKVHEVYDDLRKNILSKFFNALEEKLRKHLSDQWVVDNELKNDIYVKK